VKYIEGVLKSVTPKLNDDKHRRVLQVEEMGHGGRFELTDVMAGEFYQAPKIGETIKVPVQAFAYLKQDRDGKTVGAGLSWSLAK
jgi:hypothetical protein